MQSSTLNIIFFYVEQFVLKMRVKSKDKKFSKSCLTDLFAHIYGHNDTVFLDTNSITAGYIKQAVALVSDDPLLIF